jgi:anti-anti-sigma factor
MTKAVVKKNIIPPSSGISVTLVKSRKNPDVLMLRASGEFASHECLHCGQDFANNLQKAFTGEGKRKIFILNLAGVTRLDAIGAGSIASFIRKCQKSDTKLILCTAQGYAKEVLKITKLISCVAYYDTEKEALASLNK